MEKRARHYACGLSIYGPGANNGKTDNDYTVCNAIVGNQCLVIQQQVVLGQHAIFYTCLSVIFLGRKPLDILSRQCYKLVQHELPPLHCTLFVLTVFLLPLRSRPLLQGGAELGGKVAFLSLGINFCSSLGLTVSPILLCSH
jgi:hypothetical protein